jgi:hypothetical protein
VLEVMRILHEEMELREETRALEQARPALATVAHGDQAQVLAETQDALAERVAGVHGKIRDLPDGETGFAREIALLTRVQQVMLDAHQLLARHVTGAETIAAETEAIELLLQSRRINPKSGGGGGSSPGGGGIGDTSQSALALLGIGQERQAAVVTRHVHQATGVSGMELPAEFRQGLDAFFQALEQSGAAGPR